MSVISFDIQQLLLKSEQAEVDKHRLIDGLRQFSIASLSSEDYLKSKVASNTGFRVDFRPDGIDVVVSLSHAFPVTLVGPSWFISVEVENSSNKHFEVTRQFSEDAELTTGGEILLTLPLPISEMASLPWFINVALIFNPVDLVQEQCSEKIVLKRLSCLANQPVTCFDILSRREFANLVPPLCYLKPESSCTNSMMSICWRRLPEFSWVNVTGSNDSETAIGVAFYCLNPFGCSVELRAARSDQEGTVDVTFSTRDCVLAKQLIDSLFTLTVSVAFLPSKIMKLISQTSSSHFGNKPLDFHHFIADQNDLQTYANELSDLSL